MGGSCVGKVMISNIYTPGNSLCPFWDGDPWPFQRLSDLHLGDQKVTLNQLAYLFSSINISKLQDTNSYLIWRYRSATTRVPSLKLTYPLKRYHPKRKIVPQPPCFRGYVSFGEGITCIIWSPCSKMTRKSSDDQGSPAPAPSTLQDKLPIK